MQFFQDADYKFIEHRRKAYTVSAIVVGVGILAMLLFAATGRGWVNYGVDFTGGTIMQVEFAQPIQVGELRAALGELPTAEITQFGAANEFLVRVPDFAEAEITVSEVMMGMLDESFGPAAYEVARVEAVGPTIGAELQQRALIAILLSFVLTLVYLAFRFEWRFGVAAVIAAMHDILITLGFLALFRIEVSLPTVAAVLTIIGYSLNDTIVVFDRIRENLKKGARRVPYIDILNRSINDVLPRTVMTSGTTFVVLLSLFVLGGAIIRDFAMILMLGVLIGTYSSIFVAAPALLEIEERTGEKHPTPKARAKPAKAAQA